MRIHSFSLSKTPAFLGFWNIDFEREPTPFSFPLKGEKSLALFLASLRYLFFNKQEEKLGVNPRAELTFSTEEGRFNIRADNGELKLIKNGQSLDLSSENVRKEAVKLTHWDEQKLKDILCLDVNAAVSLLQEVPIAAAKGLFTPLEPEASNTIVTVGTEVTRQKSALLSVSESVIKEIEVLPEEEENKLAQQLVKVSQLHDNLQKEITNIKESVDWLAKTSLLREELGRLSKQQASVHADVARFEVKKSVLEKALKAESLTPEYEQLAALREEEKEEAKQISDLQRSIPLLSEKVRSAALAYSEAQKNLGGVLEFHEQKSTALERARTLDNMLESDTVLLMKRKETLARAIGAERSLQEENTRLKTLVSQLTIKAQLLNKKMNDLSTDALLVTELDEYKQNLLQISEEASRGDKAEEEQKQLQKQIEISKNELSDVLDAIVDLKNEELGLTGELSMKERMLSKLIGHDSFERLSSELKEQDEKLGALDSLQGRISLLTEAHERFNREKSTLEETNHALRLATVTLGGARQTYADKTAIVNSAELAFSFYLETLSLSEQRKKLVNGKPCPLCGAIHHPFSAKLPFDHSLENKLAKAKQEAAEALEAVAKEEKDFEALQEHKKASEALLQSLSGQLDQAKGDILYIAGELSVTGLREKKPIAWGAVIKQKQTSLANRRDDLEARLNKIRELAEVTTDLKERRDAVLQKAVSKKEEQTELEQALKNFSLLDQQLTKIKKETEINRVSLTRLLERSFARFGVKASTVVLLKQNLPTLEKRREQWINWSEEKKKIESDIEQNNEEMRSAAVSLTEQKRQTDLLEKEVEELQEKIKKIQKERHEAIANQTPEEVQASIDGEKANAERLSEEARMSLASREEALNSCKLKMLNIEERRSSILKTIEELSNQFSEKLHCAGFANESGFLSSQISDTQKEELKRQNHELQERLLLVNNQFEEKNAALSALLALNRTELSREKLEEELTSKSDLFHSTAAQLSSLRETMAKNANNKNRRKREKLEYEKLLGEVEHWKKLCEEAVLSGNASRLGLELSVFFGENNFSVFETGLKMKLTESGLRLRSEKVDLPFSEAKEDEKYYFALAVLLGRSELFARRSSPEFIILEETNPSSALPNRVIPGLESLKITTGIAR